MILWPVALDENGQEIHIKDAPAHGKYTCVNCHQPMKARKGEYRVIHFAHMVENESCNYESFLHLKLKDLLYDRIKNRDGIAVIRNEKRIELSRYARCEKECYVGQFKPDIYVVVDGVEYFLEICVTNPCSEEKKDSGKRIIEIRTTDDGSRSELASGDISQGAEHYSLEFYNFPLEPRIRRSVIAQEFPFNEPFDVHDNEEEDFFLNGVKPEAASPLQGDKRHVTEPEPEATPAYERRAGTVVAPPAKSVSVTTWNPNEPIPPIFHYVLYSNGSDKIIRADINRVMLRIEQGAILELGVSIADEKFSYEVGRRYAADKGLLPRELLTDIERSFDMAAIKKWLGYQEIPATSRD